MKQILLIPVIMVMFFSFASQLMDLAQASSDKAIDFSEDMANAIDCAAEARPLEECSPGIMGHDFSIEMKEAQKLNNEIAELSKSIINEDFSNNNNLADGLANGLANGYTEFSGYSEIIIEERDNETIIVLRK